METLIQNIPAAVAIILPVILALTVVTNIIVEVLKKLLWERVPTNILAFIVAMVVTLLAFFAMCRIAGICIVWYLVAGAVVLGVFVAYASMFGYDKLRQTLAQINGIKKNS